MSGPTLAQPVPMLADPRAPLPSNGNPWSYLVNATPFTVAFYSINVPVSSSGTNIVGPNTFSASNFASIGGMAVSLLPGSPFPTTAAPAPTYLGMNVNYIAQNLSKFTQGFSCPASLALPLPSGCIPSARTNGVLKGPDGVLYNATLLFSSELGFTYTLFIAPAKTDVHKSGSLTTTEIGLIAATGAFAVAFVAVLVLLLLKKRGKKSAVAAPAVAGKK